MYANQTKAALIIELNGRKDEGTVKNFIKLLDCLIHEARESNDEATHETFLQNQGKIQAYKGLKEYIERGLPGANV